jgi:AcrR family transcriptional regulator
MLRRTRAAIVRDSTSKRGTMASKRLRSPERREQVLDVTLQLIAENGVTGTTLTRIASAVGVTTPALYAHFANRKEILLAALDLLITRRTAHHHLQREGDALDRLRQLASEHGNLASSANDKSVLALFEFIAAPPAEALREALASKHRALLDSITDMVREGQVEGSIDPDVDPRQTAWMIVSRAWTEDIAYLMGLTDDWTETRSLRMLDLILDSAAVPGRTYAP